MVHPISQETCDRLARLVPVHGICAAAAIVGVNVATARKARDRGWQQGRPGPRRRPKPTDFALMANRMTVLELRQHYRVSQRAVYAWLAQTERSYTPKRPAQSGKPRPDAGTMIAAIVELGVTLAAARFGISPGTFARWRADAGLPVERKRIVQLRARQSSVGWVDRLYQERTAPHV